MEQGEFRHPLLVQVYDAECPWSFQDEYFAGLVQHIPAARVLDLGCGTGRLSLGLAASGHQVTGVDPAAASLAAARTKPGASGVTWVLGTTADLPDCTFDVAVMTSHVAQFFVEERDWSQTLQALARALVPGGRLFFDARDPSARGWERWNPTASRRQVQLADGRVVTAWTEVTSVTDSVVSFTHHYRFPDSGELRSSARLVFRSEQEIRRSLAEAGFLVDAIHGGWAGQPAGHGDGELLVQARTHPIQPACWSSPDSGSAVLAPTYSPTPQVASFGR